MFTFPPERRVKVEGKPIPIADTTQKVPMSYPLTAHWLEFSYMVTLTFKRFWEMEFLILLPKDSQLWTHP